MRRDLRFLRQVQIRLYETKKLHCVRIRRKGTDRRKAGKLPIYPLQNLRHSGKLYPVGGITFLHMNKTNYSMWFLANREDVCPCERPPAVEYPVVKFEYFFRESSPQTPFLCNEVMDLQVDYWTTGGKKEGSKVNVIGQLVVDKICWHSYSVSYRDVFKFFPNPRGASYENT